MQSLLASRRALVAALLGLAAAAACADSSGPVQRSPLDGLAFGAALDSAGNPLTPTPPGPVAPGYFRGTVRAPNLPGTGGDTLGTTPRIANVVVRAYPILSSGAGGLELGASVGSTTTDAQGRFTFPTIAGGEYAVTFTPPAGSGYQAAFVTALVNAESHTWPWWVTLQRN